MSTTLSIDVKLKKGENGFWDMAEAQEMRQVVRRDMQIGEIVQKYPAAIEPMLAAGLHCVGCHVAYWETLEQGCAGHGFSDERIDKLVEDINKALENQEEAAPAQDEKEEKPLAVTAKAAEKFKRLIKEYEKPENTMLRIQVLPGGCAGMSYGFDFEEPQNTNEDDTILDYDGVKIVIDEESSEILQGSKVDYVEALSGSGFKISNPNASQSCGCGNSFR